MSASISDLNSEPARLRVSVIARLVAAIAFSIAALGGAAGSFLLLKLFQELRTAETAGIAAVMNGMTRASLPVVASFYLAALVSLVAIIVLVVRTFVPTKTASPPFWFYAVGGVLCLIPAALFWRVEHLVIEALSPGSSIGGAGVSGVASEISTLLMISIASAPIAFIILAALSVLPFKSRPGPKWGSLIVSILIAIMFAGFAIAFPFLIDGPKRKNEMVSLPANVRAADEDIDIDKVSSVVITLTADNKLYRRQSRDHNDRAQATDALISKEQLTPAIESGLENKSPDNRIVYLKCDVNASYDNVVQVFEAIRKADADKVGLVVIGEKNDEDPYQITPLDFEVQLPPRPTDQDPDIRPNPLFLLASLSEDGRLTLNGENMGTPLSTDKLVDRLREVFKQRENNGVFREGSNEIEKAVFVKVPKSSKYGDFIRLVEAIKLSGASPIVLQIDDVSLPVSVSEKIRN
jgi:biopolymer transport protein ExbD